MEKIKFRYLFLLIIQFVSLSISFAQMLSPEEHEKATKEIAKRIFPGAPLPADYKFHFKEPFQEVFITTKDSVKLNALLFKANLSKGVILYLHGNSGALNSWGDLTKTYTALHYDVFMLDYRKYGKSPGTVKSEEQLFSDVQAAYDYLKKIYAEDKIIVLGYSIGTWPAAMLAANNKPHKLILQAPYYSMTDEIQHISPTIDTTIIPYKLNTYQLIQKIEAPIVIFHGDADETIYYGSSEKLKKLFKPADELIKLIGVGHSNITFSAAYLKELKRILDK